MDLEWYRLIARYFFQVVDELPRRERQKQRLREDLVRGLRSALDRSGYVLRELSEEERGAGDLWELRVGWAEGDPLDARRDGKLVPAIVLRGMMLAQRLCRGLSNEEALAAAERADHLVLSTGKRRRDDPGDGPGEHTFGYDHWDDESRVSPGEEIELARELGWLQLDPGAPYLVLSAQTERRPTIRIYPDGDHLWGEASGATEPSSAYCWLIALPGVPRFSRERERWRVV